MIDEDDGYVFLNALEERALAVFAALVPACEQPLEFPVPAIVLLDNPADSGWLPVPGRPVALGSLTFLSWRWWGISEHVELP